MRDRGGAVLYVGKAANLRRRVRSYFGPGGRHGRQIGRVLAELDRVDHERCGSELEALLRESELLRQLRPPGNRRGVGAPASGTSNSAWARRSPACTRWRGRPRTARSTSARRAPSGWCSLPSRGSTGSCRCAPATRSAPTGAKAACCTPTAASAPARAGAGPPRTTRRWWPAPARSSAGRRSRRSGSSASSWSRPPPRAASSSPRIASGSRPWWAPSRPSPACGGPRPGRGARRAHVGGRVRPRLLHRPRAGGPPRRAPAVRMARRRRRRACPRPRRPRRCPGGPSPPRRPRRGRDPGRAPPHARPPARESRSRRAGRSSGPWPPSGGRWGSYAGALARRTRVGSPAPRRTCRTVGRVAGGGGLGGVEAPLRAAAALPLSGRYARPAADAAAGLRAWARAAGARLRVVDAGEAAGAAGALTRELAPGGRASSGPYGSGATRAAARALTGEPWVLWNHGGAAWAHRRPGGLRARPRRAVLERAGRRPRRGGGRPGAGRRAPRVGLRPGHRAGAADALRQAGPNRS